MSLDLSRRAFVSTSLATGFALAVRPVSAETITTDAAGLAAKDVKIAAPGGKEMPGYEALPEGKGPFPLVIVVQEIFGVHEHIKDLCRRLAKAGYYAIAPELYFRHGDPKTLAIEDVLKLVGKIPDEEVLADLDAAIAHARKSGKIDGNRVALTGFCWGGRIAWLAAARGNVKTAAAWYGRISNAPNSLTPRSALDVAASLKVPVLGLYAGHDSGIPLAHVELMKTELAKGKSGSEIVVYPEAQHGFNADYRASYSARDAADAWAKMLSWFKQHGA